MKERVFFRLTMYIFRLNLAVMALTPRSLNKAFGNHHGFVLNGTDVEVSMRMSTEYRPAIVCPKAM